MGGRLCKSPPWIPFLFTAILFPMGKRKAESVLLRDSTASLPNAPGAAGRFRSAPRHFDQFSALLFREKIPGKKDKKGVDKPLAGCYINQARLRRGPENGPKTGRPGRRKRLVHLVN